MGEWGKVLKGEKETKQRYKWGKEDDIVRMLILV